MKKRVSIFEVLDGPKVDLNQSAGAVADPVPPSPPPPPEVIGARLPDGAVIELFEERAAIQQTDNIELIRHHERRGSPADLLRRHCELLAAADLSMTYGTYVEPIIRPRITPASIQTDKQTQ